MKGLRFLRTAVLALGIVALGLVGIGCTEEFDPTSLIDRIDDLEDRVEALEIACNKMNTNITSLQAAVAALEKGDYVTKVEPLMEDGTLVGYTIYFAKSNPIVIYNGTDGKDGVDGSTPIISVKEEDGVYYWAVNGEYLLDGAGNKIPVNESVVPQLKVEDGKWWVSYDNGQKWTEVGDASGNSDIEVTQDENYVYITFNGETFTLPKNPSQPEAQGFVFTVTSVTSSSVVLDVDASDDEMRYLVMAVEKAYADQFADDEALYQDDLEYFEYIMAAYGLGSVSEVISAYTTVGDSIGLEISDLTPETEYLFYAYGLELDGTRTTDIYREYVTTLAESPVENVDITFEFDIQSAGGSYDITVTPSKDDVYYYFDCLDKASLDEFYAGNSKTLVEELLAYYISSYASYGMTAEDVMLELASKGVDSYPFELNASTEYVVFAMAVDLKGNVISEPSTKNFTTESVAPSENVITMTVDSKTSSSITVSTTTTNDDPYFLGLEPAYYFEGMTDEEIMELIIAEYGEYIDWSTENGNVEALELVDLMPDTEYLLMAFGVQSGTPTTALVKQLVSTDAGTDPSLCTFDIAVSNLSATTATVTVTPSADDVRYLWDIVPTGVTDAEILAIYQEEIEYYTGMGAISGALEYYQMMSYKGVDYWDYENLDPGTTYEVFVAVVDMSKGELLKPFTRKSFTTLGASATQTSVESAEIALRKLEKPSRKMGLTSHRTAVARPQTTDSATMPSMRRIDVQNPTKVHAKKTARHSAFILK